MFCLCDMAGAHNWLALLLIGSEDKDGSGITGTETQVPAIRCQLCHSIRPKRRSSSRWIWIISLFTWSLEFKIPALSSTRVCFLRIHLSNFRNAWITFTLTDTELLSSDPFQQHHWPKRNSFANTYAVHPSWERIDESRYVLLSKGSMLPRCFPLPSGQELNNPADQCFLFFV